MSDSQLIAQLRTVVDPLFNGIIFNAIACGNYVNSPVTMSGELTIKTGIYTLLFVQAMWSLHTKGNKGFYFLALIGLWSSVIYAFVVFWKTTWNGCVAKNGSPLAIALNTNAVSPVLLVFTITPIFFADGILIWRCNIMWGSRYILAMLLMLYAASIGVAMVSIIPTTVPLPLPLFTLSSLFSAVTTLLATFLLVLKIVFVTRKSRMQHSYTKILQILIESAALVSFVMLSTSTLALISDVHPFALKTKIGTILYSGVQKDCTSRDF
ncbi:hypothetical protein D9619_012486 [Psilocybe cf. subviscida]|uniref:Uncharacterized protein n=1 Tax=Psilocybe cf. subviscida TaxID=2480587 RepID=A0A8H5ERA9_9AGAR|nr:hypothetical protein D9619_012486 [Psilocybe cf. subviscida]